METEIPPSMKHWFPSVGSLPHTKLPTYISNKKDLHITAHASTPVEANELPVYPAKSLMCIGLHINVKHTLSHSGPDTRIEKNDIKILFLNTHFFIGAYAL